MFTKITNDLKAFHKNEEGDIVQTSIIIGIFAVIAIGALAFWGLKVKNMFNFDTMITPTIIKLIYSVFTLLSVLFGLIMIIGGIGARYGGGSKVLMGL